MIVGAVFGYGHPGSTTLHPQARARCDKATKMLQSSVIDYIYLGSVLAPLMREYILQKGISEKSIFVFPNGRTSAGEIKVFASVMPKDAVIITISNTYHLPRLRLIWKAYGRGIETASVRRETSASDFVKEFFKFIAAFIAPRAFSRTSDTVRE